MKDIGGSIVGAVLGITWGIIIFLGSIGLAIDTAFYCCEQIARLFL